MVADIQHKTGKKFLHYFTQHTAVRPRIRPVHASMSSSTHFTFSFGWNFHRRKLQNESKNSVTRKYSQLRLLQSNFFWFSFGFPSPNKIISPLIVHAFVVNEKRYSFARHEINRYYVDGRAEYIF